MFPLLGSLSFHMPKIFALKRGELQDGFGACWLCSQKNRPWFQSCIPKMFKYVTNREIIVPNTKTCAFKPFPLGSSVFGQERGFILTDLWHFTLQVTLAQLLIPAHFIANGRRQCPPRPRFTPSCCEHLKQIWEDCRGDVSPHWLTPSGHLKSGERNPTVSHWEISLETSSHPPCLGGSCGSHKLVWWPSEEQGSDSRGSWAVFRRPVYALLCLSHLCCVPGIACSAASQLWLCVGFSNRCEMALCCQHVFLCWPAASRDWCHVLSIDGLVTQLAPAAVRNAWEVASKSIYCCCLIRLSWDVLLNWGSSSFC